MKLKDLISFLPIRTGLLVVTGLYLAACTTTVAVDGHFPAPVGQNIPIVVGLYFAPEFKNYAPEEILYQRNNWKVELGPVSVQMFQQVFANLGKKAIVLKDRPEAGNPVDGVDLVVIPSFADFGLLDPSATPLEFFSLSFKYKIDVFSPDGKLVADWVINAYGKAPPYALNEDKSVKEALMVALRDAAASLTLEFPRQPGVIRYMRSIDPDAVAQAERVLQSE